MTTPTAGSQAGTAGPAERGLVRKDLKLGSERGFRDFALGLASLPFVGHTLRRRRRLWLAFGFAGLLIGVGFYAKAPPPYQAQTKLLLAQPADVAALDAITTDVTLGQNPSMAQIALHKLGLNEPVAQFLSSYTVEALTPNVVAFTVGGPTASQAVARAKALAYAYLRYRDETLQESQRLYAISVGQQISRDSQLLAVNIPHELSHFRAEPQSAERDAAIKAQLLRQENLHHAVTAFKQKLLNAPDSTRALESGSKTLYAAALLPRSHFKVPALYAIAGLLGGLALGMGYVVIAGLVSDRLRRRDDVARALGTPVALSVGAVKFSRLPGRRGIRTVRRREVQRMAALLRTSLPPRQPGVAATLAVIAVDDPRVAALPVLALAVSAARSGSQVIVADLTPGAAAARLLGITDPGVRIVATGGQQIALVVPELGDLTPAGPLHRAPEPVRAGSFDHGGGRAPADDGFAYAGDFDRAFRDSAFGERGSPDRGSRGRGVKGRFRSRSFVSNVTPGPLAAAYESADLMLTVATLDPGLGAEHLLSWAGKSMVIVTAGHSSATRIHATGEMLRSAGLPPTGAILVAADKGDLTSSVATPRAAGARPPSHRPQARSTPPRRPASRQSVTRPTAPRQDVGAPGR
jgi:hypothetical protein